MNSPGSHTVDGEMECMPAKVEAIDDTKAFGPAWQRYEGVHGSAPLSNV